MLTTLLPRYVLEVHGFALCIKLYLLDFCLSKLAQLEL